MMCPMNEREYDRMKKAIEEECRKKLEALDLVWEMSGGALKKKRSITEGGLKRGELRGAITAAVATMTADFKPSDVLLKIRAHNQQLASQIKPASLSGTLKRMADAGDIEVVFAGVGKRASLYRVKKHGLKAVGD